MTTELEKTFFDTFGIEPRKVKICTSAKHCSRKYKLCNDDCKHWEVVRTDYPQITDRHYLELICLYNRHSNLFISSASEIENLKIHILSSLVSNLERENTDELKHQVQAIFKESEQE